MVGKDTNIDIAVVGAGAWGTALATAADRSGANVLIWAREQHVAEAINQQHENTTFLKGIRLKPTIKATYNLDEVMRDSALCLVVPSQYLRGTIAQLKNLGLPEELPLILCSKGIEQDSLKLMHEVVEELVPNPIYALSGPTFASEVALGLPTSVTLAGENRKQSRQLAKLLQSDVFKVYFTNDMVGAEIGGAVKNVMAIACGMAEGKRLGKNAVAALITRGIKEMKRLCVAKGGKPKTLMELCGIGDLILTCSSQHSRNMSLGYALGEGRTLDEVLGERNTVAEGVASSESVVALAKSLEVSIPVCEAVYRILHGKADIDETIKALVKES